jgi:lysozyme
VLDLSAYQSVASFHDLVRAGIEGVILRCIRQNGEMDEKYDAYAARAKSVGLCVGAYLFLNASDGALQADKLLSCCRSGVGLALDWETSGVSLWVAEDAAQRIVDRTAVMPLIYGSRAFLEAAGISKDSILAKCPLWLAEYGPEAHVPGPWEDWAIWQYTDRRVSPGLVSDGDLFHRPAGQLKDWWAGIRLGVAPFAEG